MRPELVAALLESGIPFVGGIYATLLGFRVVGPKQGTQPKFDEWHRRWGGFMRVCGPFLVLFAFFLLVKGLVFHSSPIATPATTWTRYKSSDGVASVEFPAPPMPTTKEADGVVMYNVTLSDKDRDRHFILSWSEVVPDESVTEEGRLDSVRETLPAMTAQQGTPLTFVSEEKFTELDVPGRVFVFDGKGKYTLRMKCLILNGRFYRATATTPRGPEDEADGVRFVSSFRLEKATK